MITTMLCKTIECKNWFNCGSNYCAAGKTIVKKTKKETLYLCKEFEKKGRLKAEVPVSQAPKRGIKQKRTDMLGVSASASVLPKRKTNRRN